MDGVDNLFSQGIITLIRTFQDDGDNVLVILDADTINKGWGFEARKMSTIEKMRKNEIEFPFFLLQRTAPRDNVPIHTVGQRVCWSKC